MSKQDYDKIEKALDGILLSHSMMQNTAAENEAKNMIAIDLELLWEQLNIQNIAKRRAHDVVSDMLSTTVFCRKYGEWVIAEVESKLNVLVKLPAATQTMQQAQFVDGVHLTRVVNVADAIPGSMN